MYNYIYMCRSHSPVSPAVHPIWEGSSSKRVASCRSLYCATHAFSSYMLMRVI